MEKKSEMLYREELLKLKQENKRAEEDKEAATIFLYDLKS